MVSGSVQDAVILAAGCGRRLGRLGEGIPKTLLEVGGRSLLGRMLEALLERGVSRVTVVTGHHGDRVERYLRRWPASVKALRNPCYAVSNNITSLEIALAGHQPVGDVLLLEGDLLLDGGLLDRLLAVPPGSHALLAEPGLESRGTLATVIDGTVGSLDLPESQDHGFDHRGKWKTVNAYRIERDLWGARLRQTLHRRLRHQGGRNLFYEVLFGDLIAEEQWRLGAVFTGELPWAEIDTVDDLRTASIRFAPEQRRHLVEESHGGNWRSGMLDFSRMANVRFPGPRLSRALADATPRLLEHYGSRQQLLDEKLARVLGCEAGHLRAAAGASQLFPLLRALPVPRPVLLPRPTFGEYPRVFGDGAMSYLDRAGSAQTGVDLEALENLVPRARTVVLVSPNNPTGTTLPTGWIHALALRHPRRLFLVDESFIAFSGQTSLLDRLERSPRANVLVLGSLGKSMGVPGLRLGYAYSSNRAVLAGLDEALPIWGLSSLAEYFLEELPHHMDELEESWRRTVGDREALRQSLAELPVVARAFESGGNFLLVRLDGGAELAAGVADLLASAHTMLVKDVSRRLDDGAPYLRIAVRRPQDNARLVAALASLGKRLRVRPKGEDAAEGSG